ncbi:MAG TPA: hypothetical protein PL069_01860 [Saprospiraceae bacterium]|nr:hypothetical protein [Saprospiraceae bacterium]
MNSFLFYEHEKIPYDSIRLFAKPSSRERLKAVLSKLWYERNRYGLPETIGEEYGPEIPEQQFFTFYDTYAKAGNYVGVIRYDDITIQILPKIFESSHQRKDETVRSVNAHLIWWLSYGGKIKLPKSRTYWDTYELDLPDILIFLFASLTKEDLIFNKHQTYVESEESLNVVRGRIDFKKYLTNYVTANPHIIPCIYSSLEIDNPFNRIVKYTARMLHSHTENKEIRRLLEEIDWILDDVSLMPASVNDCNKVKISNLNDTMQVIIDYCRLFISGLTLKSSEDDLDIFAFLIPMEDLFEDFIFGFIKERFEYQNNVLSIVGQSGNKENQTQWLATERTKKDVRYVFPIRPDIYVNRTNGDLILDTKYKKIYSKEEAKELGRLKSGASIDDIYQMIGYAIKYKVSKIHLLFPDKLDTYDNLSSEYIIKDNLCEIDGEITIQYHRLPIINKNFELFNNPEDEIKSVFETQAVKMDEVIEQILYAAD